VGVAFNMAMAVSTRHGGATVRRSTVLLFFQCVCVCVYPRHVCVCSQLMWFVRAVSVPTTGLLFSIHAIMGASTTTLSGYDVGGLLAVFLGLVVYNLCDVKTWLRMVSKCGQSPGPHRLPAVEVELP
jgi:hypothetical protein